MGEVRPHRPFSGPSFVGRGGEATRMGAALIWLVFIVFPLVDAFGRHQALAAHLLTIAATAVFVVVYIALVFAWRSETFHVPGRSLVVVLIALATALTAADGSTWGFMFTYCAACVAFVWPGQRGFAGLLICAALAVSTCLVSDGNGGAALGYAASTLGVGLLMLVMRDLRERNYELGQARAELARLAVAQERERFARDLHDLLGHSLSVIALKAELAKRLVAGQPESAAVEIAELEEIARGALGEVRQAVSGYRRPTLAGELAGARMALGAAGIEVTIAVPDEHELAALDPEVVGVLAWAVREGATNVSRHSKARRCSVRAGVEGEWVVLEMSDDGVGGAGAATGGHGLDGVRERAAAVGGSVTAGPGEGAGFTLHVRVPVRRSEPSGPVADAPAPAPATVP